jgi:hypothetical protein
MTEQSIKAYTSTAVAYQFTKGVHNSKLFFCFWLSPLEIFLACNVSSPTFGFDFSITDPTAKKLAQVLPVDMQLL